jgi:hypothetical protein
MPMYNDPVYDFPISFINNSRLLMKFWNVMQLKETILCTILLESYKCYQRSGNAMFSGRTNPLFS